MDIQFILIGSFLAVIIWVFQRKKLKIILKTSMLSTLIVCFSISLYLINQEVFLGKDQWYEQSPYKEMLLLIIMLFGMTARYLTKAIEERREKIKKLKKQGGDFKNPGLKFDVWEFSYPLFLSVVTFGVLLSQVRDEVFSINNIVLSFQTGFFWQTIIKKEVGG